ncbi:uncharacterized protein LOC143299641 [Babylonia areolata]|uniref:uncharacterized protein LOC143299641 n=1 Tax=Babylonia areolata TaxID=304850 RepID=UPI003FD199A6
MSCPGTYPSVLNGKIDTTDPAWVEYECLTGFYMTGSKRIKCTAGVWEAPPNCSVIRQHGDADVFPDWWFYILAILLALLVLACFLCLIFYFCCCRGANAVFPYSHHSTAVCCGGRCECCEGCEGCEGCGGCGGCACCRSCGGCACCSCCRRRKTGSVEEGEVVHTHDGVYFVPVQSTPTQGLYYARTRPAITSRSTNTDTDDLKKRTRNTAINTDNANNSSDTGPKGVSYMYGYGGSNATPNGTPRDSGSHAWSENRGAKGYHGSQSKAWKDSSNMETRSDGDLDERPIKPKKPAKEVRAWLPHSHPVRKINTSTK